MRKTTVHDDFAISSFHPQAQSDFCVAQHSVFILQHYQNVYLSLASPSSIPCKDPSSEAELKRGRLTVNKHFEKLLFGIACRGGDISSARSYIAFSCRNVLANIRCGGWIRGVTPSLLTCDREDASLSMRPYHFLGYREGRFHIEEAFPTSTFLDKFEWAVTGAPICWDAEDVEDRLLGEISDFAHLFYLPRGGNPNKTIDSVNRWRSLRRLADECLYMSLGEAVKRIRPATRGLTPETSYLHNCAGVTDDGKLVVIIANGSLARIGCEMAQYGVRRAIVLDNGGSSSVFRFSTTKVTSGKTLFASPCFRSRGTAYIFAALPHGTYTPISALGKCAVGSPPRSHTGLPAVANFQQF